MFKPKITIGTLSLIFTFLNCQAQVWVDQGAVWHYSIEDASSGGFNKLTYEKDTIIDGYDCQKIQVVAYRHGFFNYTDTIEPRYTHVSGDTVFYRHNNRFFTLYNFGASIGDSWIISIDQKLLDCGDTSRVKVIDAGDMQLNGNSYRFIELASVSGSRMALEGVFVERIGCISKGSISENKYIFPSSKWCDTSPDESPGYSFSCFKDNSFSLYNPTGEPCEKFASSENQSAGTYRENLTLFPNPSRGIYNLSLNTANVENARIEVYSLNGRLIKAFHLKGNSFALDVSKQEKGIYLLKCYSDNFHSVKKVIRN